MRYEWDRRKNRENQRKHGVSFELAALVFEDENRFIEQARVDETGIHTALYQGTTSVVPKRAGKTRGF
jgi:uncharacterized DUF497 family protein